MRARHLVIAGAILLGACSGIQPIYEVRNHPIPAQTRVLPLDQIEEAIVEAGSARKWRFERVAPGQLRAYYERASYRADIMITVDTSSYSITYLSSAGLKEPGSDGIDRHYNSWVKTLETDIDVKLSALGFRR